jgi:hypothetical protein
LEISLLAAGRSVKILYDQEYIVDKLSLIDEIFVKYILKNFKIEKYF